MALPKETPNGAAEEKIMKKQYDILVFGGGTAGTVAALQAARGGSSVLLIEKSPGPGGTISRSLIRKSGLFHAWGKQVIAGIGWELETECAALAGLPLPDFSHWKTGNVFDDQILLNPVLFSLLCEEKLSSAGVDRSYHTLAADAEYSGGKWTVLVCTIEGLREISATILIDCTGDASVVGLAGFARKFPDPCQPGTLCCGLSGYSPETLDRDKLKQAVNAAVDAGNVEYGDFGWSADHTDLRLFITRGDNGNHIAGKHLFSSEGRTRLEIDARMSLLRMIRFCRNQPELNTVRLDYIAAECGVRESATIVGEHTVTKEEYLSATVYPDAVCHAFYPLDLHGGKMSKTIADRLPPPGRVPCIPLRSLIPRGSRNLLTAGRCLASDREANSALRVQAASMASGQAAGGAAVTAIRRGVSPADVPIGELRKFLAAQGAIVPGKEADPGAL